MTLATMLGARQHYQPLAMLARAGLLARLITDAWNPVRRPPHMLNYLLPNVLQRAAGRYHPDIPSARVVSFNSFGLRYRIDQFFAGDRTSLYSVFENAGQRFAMRALPHLGVEHSVFFGYSSAALETMRHEHKNGIRCVIDQIDPAKVEYELVADEEKRFPHLATPSRPIPNTYFERLRSEWSEADGVLVNSEWSKRALILQGVSPEKLVVVPLPYASPKQDLTSRREPHERVRVLWLGTLDLRKGLPYALDAARQLTRDPVDFTFAGPISITARNLRFPANCAYVGQVPRLRAPNLYAEHDIFLLPTLSDGFAITQIEAMAFGLPVIATPNCGDVVEHERSGLIIPVRDARAIAEAIRLFVDNRTALQTYSGAAYRRAEAFTPEKLWPAYHNALYHRFGCNPPKTETIS
jgi:glycosyltransferase involved in cell wall biosynthesis